MLQNHTRGVSCRTIAATESFSARRFAAPLLAVILLIAAFGVRQARAAPFVYMPGFSAVTVIDTATNALVASVTVPFAYTTAAAMTPDGNRVYVAGLTSPSGDTALVCVIDTATNMVVATIPVPPEAQAQNGPLKSPWPLPRMEKPYMRRVGTLAQSR